MSWWVPWKLWEILGKASKKYTFLQILLCIFNFETCKLLVSWELHLFVVGAKPFPINQNVKNQCFRCALHAFLLARWSCARLIEGDHFLSQGAPLAVPWWICGRTSVACISIVGERCFKRRRPSRFITWCIITSIHTPLKWSAQWAQHDMFGAWYDSYSTAKSCG